MTHYTIKNPKEDSYGNKKENIFIAFDNNDNYLGSGYIYPNLNYDMTPEHPLNIYLDINMAKEDDLGNEVSCELLQKLQVRASEVKEANKDIPARLYIGIVGENKAKFDFFESKGFVHDEGTHLLEIKLSDYLIEKKDSEGIDIKQNLLNNEGEKEQLINNHNVIFIRSIDNDFFDEMNKHELRNHYTAYYQNIMIGHIMIYADKDLNGRVAGKIENLFVLNNWRNKRIAKRLMDEAMDYFKSNGIEHVRLEVWNANKVAYEFYIKLGFKFIAETEQYPGYYL